MRYIIESIYNGNGEDLIKVFQRESFEDAKSWAQFLDDNYPVDTKIYTGDEYWKLHPDRYLKYVDVFYIKDELADEKDVIDLWGIYPERDESSDPDYDEELEYSREGWAY